MLTINDGTGNFSLSYLSMILHTFSGRIGSTGFIWSLRKSAIASLKLVIKGKREITYVRLDCSHVGLTFET